MWIVDDNTGRVSIDPDAIDAEKTATYSGVEEAISREMRAAVAWAAVEALPNQSWSTVKDDSGKSSTVLVDPDAPCVHFLGPGVESGTFCFHTVGLDAGGELGSMRASLCIGVADGGMVLESRLEEMSRRLLVPSVDPDLAANLQRILSDLYSRGTNCASDSEYEE